MGPMENKIKTLPLELQQEVSDFVDFLIEKKSIPAQKRKLKQDWAGSLSEYRDQFTALQLQEKAGDWRGV